MHQAQSREETFVLRALRRLVLRRRRRFFTTTVVPSAAILVTLAVLRRRRRRVFRVVAFFLGFVVRRFLRLTPPLPDLFGAFRFLALDTLVSATGLTTGDDDAPMSASSCNSNYVCSSQKNLTI